MVEGQQVKCCLVLSSLLFSLVSYYLIFRFYYYLMFHSRLVIVYFVIATVFFFIISSMASSVLYLLYVLVFICFTCYTGHVVVALHFGLYMLNLCCFQNWEACKCFYFSFSGRDFIAPCKCKGTSKFVHRECLDHWRAVKVCVFLGF